MNCLGNMKRMDNTDCIYEIVIWGGKRIRTTINYVYVYIVLGVPPPPNIDVVLRFISSKTCSCKGNRGKRYALESWVCFKKCILQPRSLALS